MKILRGRVDWMIGRANRPELFLLVDEIPSLEELRFDIHDKRGEIDGGFYFAELRGYCQFYMYYGKGNNGGFGGAKFNVTMRDGEKRTLLGPWSSRSAVANEWDFGPCTEAFMTTDALVYADNGPWNAGAVLISLLRESRDVINIGTGYTWRPGAPYAAEIVFPANSRLAIACAGDVTLRGQHNRETRYVARPEEFGDGTRISDIQHALRAALALDNRHAQVATCPVHGADFEDGCVQCLVRQNRARNRSTGHELAYEIARRYQLHLPPYGDPLDILLSLTAYEPAVQFPDGEVWVKPVS